MDTGQLRIDRESSLPSEHADPHRAPRNPRVSGTFASAAGGKSADQERTVGLAQVLDACRQRGEPLAVPVACHIARHALSAAAQDDTQRSGSVEDPGAPHDDEDQPLRDRVRLRIDGSIELTGSAGVQGVAILLNDMLSGGHGSAGDVDASSQRSLGEVSPTLPGSVKPELPAALDAFLARGLSGEPGTCFETASDMEQELMRFQQEAAQSCSDSVIAALVAGLAGQSDTGDEPEDADETGLDAFDDLAPVNTIDDMLEDQARTSGEPAGSPPASAASSVGDDEWEVVERAEAAGQEATPLPSDEGVQQERTTNAAEIVLTGNEHSADEDASDFDQHGFDPDEPTLVRPMSVPWLAQERAGGDGEARQGKPSPFPSSSSAGSEGAPVAPARSARHDETLRVSTEAPSDLKAAYRRTVGRLAQIDQRLIVGAALAIAAVAAFAALSWPSNDPAVIQLSTSPRDANVLLNGATVSTASPHILSSVEPDKRHVLAVQKRGYRGWHTVLTLTPGQVLTMPEVALLPEESSGSAGPAGRKPAASSAAAQ